MLKEIIFTIPAQEDLRAIKQFICCDNFETAQQVVEYIIDSVEKLKDNPSIGRAGRVLRTIYVLRVLHTSRKWQQQ